MLRDELIAAIFRVGPWPRGQRRARHTTHNLDPPRLAQLVKLVLWIEEKAGRPIDATAVDIATECDHGRRDRWLCRECPRQRVNSR